MRYVTSTEQVARTAKVSHSELIQIMDDLDIVPQVRQSTGEQVVSNDQARDLYYAIDALDAR